jgi:hypothetical protein
MVCDCVTRLITYDPVRNQLMPFTIQESVWKALRKCDSSVHAELSVGVSANSKCLPRNGLRLCDACLTQHELV